MRRSKKRRAAEDVDDEHHGEFDANELRQHEEFTKVKNVNAIELGRYVMETWYFSPLPAEYNGSKVRARPGLLLGFLSGFKGWPRAGRTSAPGQES